MTHFHHIHGNTDNAGSSMLLHPHSQSIYDSAYRSTHSPSPFAVRASPAPSSTSSYHLPLSAGTTTTTPMTPAQPAQLTEKQKQTAEHNAAYGILDETNTSLWDLKDGPDGYTGKPPYPYLTLIRIALLSSEHKKLTLQELYDVMEQRYPFFKGDAKGWKNSVRHNLSLNKCFKKEARHVLDPGKGSYWYVDLEEEHSTPRVRNRRRTNETNAPNTRFDASEEQGEGSVSPQTSSSRKRKHPSPETFRCGSPDSARDVKPRIGDFKLPPSNIFIPPSAADMAASGRSISSNGLALTGLNRSDSVPGRTRAISAPSPITPSFLSGLQNVAGHPQPYQPTYQPPMAYPAYGHGHAHPPPSYAFPMTQHHTADFVPYITPAIAAGNVHSAHSSRDASRTSSPQQQQSASVSVAPHEHRVPDSAASAMTVSTTGPETPRTLFSHMLRAQTESSSSTGTGSDPQTLGEDGRPTSSASAVEGSAGKIPPGPTNGYAFPAIPTHAPTISANVSGLRHIPPMPAPSHPYQGGYPVHRPAPLPLRTTLPGHTHRDSRVSVWAPSPTTAALVQSPTRLLPSGDYEKLFSSAPFGMMWSDAARKNSRSGSIFGVINR